MSQYVDISSNNGTPNVAAYAAAGHDRISVKVSEGTGYHWFGGETVIDQAHAHGLTVEHYHWLRPDSSATAQADYYLRYVEKRFRHGDDAMTDFERTYGVHDPSDAKRADQLAEFNERITTRLARPRVYTGNWYLAAMGEQCQAECRRWDIVMSDYSGASELPNPYGLRYVAWQFTDRAHVAGIPGPVDYNRTLTAAAAPDSGSHQLIPTSTSPQEAGSMFEILYDTESNVWYAWAPGYWHRIASSDELVWAANSALCVNGKYVLAELKKPAKKRTYPHMGVSNAHAIIRKTLATKG